MNDTTEPDKLPPTLPKSYLNAMPTALDLGNRLTALTADLAKLEQQLERSAKAGAINAAKSFVVLRRLKDKAEDFQSQFQSIFDRYQKVVIPELFESEGVTSLPLAEGYRVGISNKFYASIKKDMRDKAWAWLKKHGLKDLITETVNASSLSAAIKYEIENNNLDPPEDLFTTAFVPNTSVTVTKK